MGRLSCRVHALARWVLTLPLAASLAAGLMPPLADYTYDDGERQAVLKMPDDWAVSHVDNGVRAQRDKSHDLLGTVMLGFYEYRQAPTPDKFLESALATWGEQYAQWKVTARTSPEGRPRVRLATVRFSRMGFPCRGYVMAVIGKETGTLGFAYGEVVHAANMHLDDLVQLVVAGSYGAFPIRGQGDSDAKQAFEQAKAKLYGGHKQDFQGVWDELVKKDGLDPELLGACGTLQPALRNLKGFLSQYLSARPRERVKELALYCLPTHEFNAFALGRNDAGPGFLAFHAALAQSFAALAQEYTSLRNQKLVPEALGARLTDYSGRLAEAVLRGRPLPEPEPVNFADADQAARFEKVFYGMIGLVMSHEMAHYYLRHSESGQDQATPFSIQQREVAADSAAIAHLQRAADESPNVWEGGAIHAFGFLATIDNVAQRMKGAKEKEPEFTRSHPFGSTRLDMAMAALGTDTFRFRNDPWTGSSQLETGDGGVQVVGGLEQAGGPVTQTTFTHPVSGVEFTFPAGWLAEFDKESNVLSFRRKNAGNLPMAVYSCGGKYPTPKAITDELYTEMRKSAKGFKITKDAAMDTGNAKLVAHIAVAQGNYNGADLALVALGIRSPGWNHAIMLMTPKANLDRDVADFEALLQRMRYKG